jgi:hypothetical protein
METSFPRSPKLLKGALVAFESQFAGAVPSVIVFQYNPAELTRSVADRAGAPEAGSVGAAREDAHRVQGPPVETINLTVELDAADQLDEAVKHPAAVQHGLNPSLAALELLLYPPTEQVLLNQVLAQAGTIQYCPPDLPLVLFVWGRSKVVPVRLTSFSVTEQAFDPVLNPIRAQVELGMRVLTYMELNETSVGYHAYLASQTQKEVLARLNLTNSAEEVSGLFPL